MMPALLAWRALVLTRSGMIEAAQADIDRALLLDMQYNDHVAYRNDHFGVLVRLVQSVVANDAGRSDTIQLIQETVTMSSALGYSSWGNQLAYERARALLRSENVGSAIAAMASFDPSSEPLLTVTAAAWLARCAIVESAPAALELATSYRASVTVSDGGRLLQLQCDEVDALLQVAGGGSIEELQAVSQRWADAGRALDALRTQLVTGVHVFASGDRDAARTILDAARKGLNECGASADADRAAALLRQTGARSRAKSRTTNVGPLTKRELEIARLVASGLKNSEVAATLFLAEKTVAAHLSNIYGKVEVRSRVQLTAWIRENDPEFEASVAAAG
jgi:DNA-binding NarL/FixJ family response regulator